MVEGSENQVVVRFSFHVHGEMGESNNHSILVPSPWLDERIKQLFNSHSLFVMRQKIRAIVRFSLSLGGGTLESDNRLIFCSFLVCGREIR
jgi:hypothetical protein